MRKICTQGMIKKIIIKITSVTVGEPQKPQGAAVGDNSPAEILYQPVTEILRNGMSWQQTVLK